MTLPPPLIPDWELSPRWSNRPAADARTDAAKQTATLRCVEFRLNGAAACVPLESVERVIPRLGALTPFAGDARLSGIALFRGEPLLVVDLEEAGSATALDAELSERPALVVPHAGGRVAVAVNGPANLVEAPYEARELTGHGPLRVAGFVDGTLPLIDAESLRAWLTARLGGAR